VVIRWQICPFNRIREWHTLANPLILLARLGGFEPPTDGLEVLRPGHPGIPIETI